MEEKTDRNASPFGDPEFNKSDTTLRALSDPQSELARFLLTEGDDDMKWKSMRSNEARTAIFGKDSSMVKA